MKIIDCKKKQSGLHAFTLIEVMMAVLLSGLTTVFFYGGISYGFGAIQMAREDLRATQILVQQSEALRLASWASLANSPSTFVMRYDPSKTGNGGGGTVYRTTIQTNVASNIPDGIAYKSNMCLATITVTWTNYIGKQTIARSRQMQTGIARFGMQNYIWGAQ